jgi:hypothetical protein
MLILYHHALVAAAVQVRLKADTTYEPFFCWFCEF